MKIRTKTRWFGRGFVCVGIIVLLLGCAGEGGGGEGEDDVDSDIVDVATDDVADATDPTTEQGDNADGGTVDLDPSQASSDFEEATDPAEQQALIDEFLDVLILPPGECWDASTIVGGQQPTGIVSQWQFDQDNSGNVSYRFVGFETHRGLVLLRAIGHYKGFPTAYVETWTGEIEAFALISSEEIVHVSISPGGGLSPVSYGTNRGACL